MMKTLMVSAAFCLAALQVGCSDMDGGPSYGGPPPPPPPPPPPYSLGGHDGPDPGAGPGIRNWNQTGWVTDFAQKPLDMSRYAMGWHDEFDSCDVVNDNGGMNGAHNWYAQPGGMLGMAKMTGVSTSGAGSTIGCADGHLMLTLANPTGTQWQGALLRAFDRRYEGHHQQYGYWEARIKLPSALPPGLIPWPSFWFENRVPMSPAGTSYTEVDTFEAGMISQTDLTAQALTLHEWPAKTPQPGDLPAHLEHSFHNHYAIFDDQWHTYGFRWTPNWYIYYRDGAEVARHHIPDGEHQVPMYPELDVSIRFDPSHAPPNARYTMYVDYVRTYQCADGSPQC